jgi:hypothetical protein
MLGLALACLASCREAREQRADEEDIGRRMDSLASTGAHGYYVALYIVGRALTSRVKGMPFEISVNRMDDRLNGLPIGMHMVDTTHYEISYDGKTGVTKAIGEVNTVLNTDDIELTVICPPYMGKSLEAMLERPSNFEFVVHKY